MLFKKILFDKDVKPFVSFEMKVVFYKLLEGLDLKKNELA